MADLIDSVTAIFGDTPSPFVDPKSWDTITVAGTKFTTKFQINGASRPYKWQSKDPAGVDGVTLTYRGKKKATFSIDFYIWTHDLYQQWINFSKPFLYKNQQKVTGVDISHPTLQNVGITQVICEELGALELVSDSELMWKVTVKLSEFFPSPKINVTTTPAGSKTTTSIPGQAFDPDVQKAEAALAAAQATATNNGLPPPFGLPP